MDNQSEWKRYYSDNFFENLLIRLQPNQITGTGGKVTREKSRSSTVYLAGIDEPTEKPPSYNR
jgi:hypothetical protein